MFFDLAFQIIQGIQSLMNVYMLFSAHVQELFVIIRVCGGINLKANNFH